MPIDDELVVRPRGDDATDPAAVQIARINAERDARRYAMWEKVGIAFVSGALGAIPSVLTFLQTTRTADKVDQVQTHQAENAERLTDAAHKVQRTSEKVDDLKANAETVYYEPKTDAVKPPPAKAKE